GLRAAREASGLSFAQARPRRALLEGIREGDVRKSSSRALLCEEQLLAQHARVELRECLRARRDSQDPSREQDPGSSGLEASEPPSHVRGLPSDGSFLRREPRAQDRFPSEQRVSMKRKICIITGSRAEYGILRPLIRAVSKDPALELQLVATGMHLSKDHGL